MLPDSVRAEFQYVAIVVANLATLAVVWWGGWNVHALLVVYWIEFGIVAAVYFAKIVRAEGSDDPGEVPSRVTLSNEPVEELIGAPNRRIADVIVLNFTGPWLAFGLLFVIAPLFDQFEWASPEVVALATVGVVAYDVLSYWFEYVGLGEYERRGPVSLLGEFSPLQWVFPLTWIFGMAAVRITRRPLGVIVVLVVLKTGVDLVVHRRKRPHVRT